MHHRPRHVRLAILAPMLLLAAPLLPIGGAAGAPASAPVLVPVWESAVEASFRSLASFDGGVEFVYANRSDPDREGLWRLDGDGLRHVAPHVWSATTRTAEGELVHAGPNGRFLAQLLETQDGPVPLVHRRTLQGFGPDGAFYSWGAEPTLFLERLTADRATSRLFEHPAQAVEEVRGVWMPDGRLLIHATGALHFLDVATGTTEPAPEGYRGVLAFDAQGRGYAISGWTNVERYDPQSGERVVVATSDRIVRDIVLAGDRVYAALDAAPPSSGAAPSLSALASAPIGATAFEGFHPSFAPAPLPDLVVRSMEDENRGVGASTSGVVAEEHVLRVRVANDGAGAAAASQLVVRQVPRVGAHLLQDCQQVLRAEVPALEPGESALLELPWRVRGASLACAGDQTFVAEADAGIWDAVVESDETNNQAVGEPHVVVGGNRAACREAVAAATGDEPLLLGLRPSVVCRVAFG